MSAPVLSPRIFAAETVDAEAADADVMSVGGTTRAIAVLVGVMTIAGAIGWALTDTATLENSAPAPLSWVCSILALGVAVWTVLRPHRAPLLAPLYAAAQGLALGSISRRYDARSEGIVLQAIGGTVAVLAAMSLLYAFGVLPVTDRFRTRVLGASAGLLLFWVVTITLRGGGVTPDYLDSPGTAAIVSLVSVGVAAFFLVLDFEVITEGVRIRSPRRLEWYAALGLVITLVWLYLELLALMGEGDDD